jgi:purine-binding chemotaxis protein CheW
MMDDRKMLCTFRLDGHWFGIDVSVVQEVIREQEMTALRWANDAVQGLLNLRGQIVTAIDLRRGLGMAARPDLKRGANVVVRVGTSAVSLWVDDVGDVVEVDMASFERAPATLGGVSRDMIYGVYKLDDHLLLALDLTRVVGAVMT